MAKPELTTVLKDYPKSVRKTSGSDQLVRLVDILQKIDTASPVAKLNETSISDNNGGRIVL